MSAASSAAAAAAAAPAAKQQDSKAKQTVVITGASRGIGLGLAGELAAKGFRVFATARTPETAKELNELAKSNANVSVLPLVVTDEKSIAALVATLTKAPYSLTSLDVLINNAGIMGPLAPKETLVNVTTKAFLDVYHTNVVAVAQITQAFLPLLKKAPHARLINLSTGMASIAGVVAGPWYMPEISYRASKAALNMLCAVQAQEFNTGVAAPDAKATAESALAASPTGRVTVIALNPGWVQTDMGSRAGSPPLTVKDSTSGIAKVVTELAPSNSARFLSYDGTSLPW